MVHILKIFYKVQNEEVQIRRLAVNSDVVARFDLLIKKIKEMYPTLAQKSFDVKWKDPENDMIYMSSDEELAQALANAEDGLLKVYVSASDLQDAHGNNETEVKSIYYEPHPRVVCDSCDKNIHGHRYKCLQCRNYDLCSTCNSANKHGDHDMIKLVRPSHVSREWVFLGSRKMWKSMFGHPCFQYMRNQKEESASKTSTDQASKTSTEQSPNEKYQWQTVFDNLLKGDYVPAEKLIKENLGNFLNLMDSVAGVDVRLENCPFKGGPSPNVSDKKVDECEKVGEKSSENLKQNVTSKDEPKQAQNSEAGHSSNEEKTENTKDAVLVELESASPVAASPVAASPVAASPVYITVNKQSKEPSKPVGLFNDLDSSLNAEGWTLLSRQEAEKKDAVPSQDTGARPKTLYPSEQKVRELEKPQSESVARELEKPQSESVARELEKPQSESDANAAQTIPEPAVTSPVSQNPEIVNALYKMQAMGFTNEGGWLERLLITKDGNINAALDALYPNTRRH